MVLFKTLKFFSLGISDRHEQAAWFRMIELMRSIKDQMLPELWLFLERLPMYAMNPSVP